jgi:hypothetical protein
MLHAKILWLANGPTLKMQGRLVGKWAKQAMSLITIDVVPKGLIVDLTKISDVDTAGEHFLSWLDSVGAVFVTSSIYATAVCDRLRLSLMERMPARQHGQNEEKFLNTHSHAV